MTRRTCLLIVLFAGVLMATTADAQWRGMGRINGKVVDEGGAPVEGAAIKAVLGDQGSTEAKTDAKGEWIIGGVARGDWEVVFSKPGMTSVKVKVEVQELRSLPPINVTLKRAG